MRKLLIFVAAIPAFIVCYLIVVTLLPDDELTSGARQWLKQDRVGMPKAQNSYPLLWGLDAPVDVDMQEYGEAVLEKVIENAMNMNVPAYEYFPDGFNHTHRIEAIGISELCTPDKVYCVDEYRKDAEESLADASNALLLQRYREMSSLPGYMNTTLSVNSVALPRISPLMNAQRMHLASIAASYSQGNKQAALSDLSADLRFCRMLLRDADILIIRMATISMISRNLHTYSQLLEMKQKSGDVVTAVKEINELGKDERDFEQVMQGELRFSHQALLSIAEGSVEDGLGMKIVRFILPFRMKRMINKVQKQYSKIAAQESLPPTRIVQQNEVLVQELMPDRWDYIGDPFTSLVFAISAPDYSRYLLRHYDLNALIRLLKLKALIKEEGVTTDKLDVFITVSPYAHAYPDESSPIYWDPGAQALRYDSVSGEEDSPYTRIFFQAD